MPNQPKPAPGTRGHYISKIPDEVWAAVQDAAASGPESVSAYTMRLWLEDLKRRERLKHPPASASVEWELP